MESQILDSCTPKQQGPNSNVKEVSDIANRRKAAPGKGRGLRSKITWWLSTQERARPATPYHSSLPMPPHLQTTPSAETTISTTSQEDPALHTSAPPCREDPASPSSAPSSKPVSAPPTPEILLPTPCSKENQAAKRRRRRARSKNKTGSLPPPTSPAPSRFTQDDASPQLQIPSLWRKQPAKTKPNHPMPAKKTPTRQVPGTQRTPSVDKSTGKGNRSRGRDSQQQK